MIKPFSKKSVLYQGNRDATKAQLRLHVLRMLTEFLRPSNPTDFTGVCQ